MTSAPGRKTSRIAGDCAQPVAGGGFTLLELVLVLAVLATLAGVTVLNLSGFAGTGELDDSADRLATALRLARAEAANQGRRIRIEPDSESGELHVLWEPEPLTRPGEYRNYPCTWRSYLPGGSVRVAGSRLTGESRYRSQWSLRAWQDGSDDRLEPVTFYPDGTSDSAELELERDGRYLVVNINGLTGTVEIRRPAPDERQSTW